MFHYIEGRVTELENALAVIDCGGVGYKLTISKNTLSHLSRLGETICLYTYFYVREEAVELLGFYSTEELAAFKLLISVSGIGPKAAMAVLSVLTPEKFALAVTTGDAKTISKAQGVGSKMAARVVLELKDKVAKEFSAEIAAAEPEMSDAEETVLGNVDEAITALMVLGYTRQEAQAALKGIAPLLPLEDMITAALRKMGAKL